MTGGLAVHRAEDCHLGDLAFDAESSGDRGVHVVGLGGGGERRITGDRGENSGFDLAEVGTDEDVAGLGDDRRAQVGGEVVEPGGRRHAAGGTVRRRP